MTTPPALIAGPVERRRRTLAGLGRLGVGTVVPVAAAVAIERWLGILVVGAVVLGMFLLTRSALRFVRPVGAHGLWLMALALSILAGEMGVVPLGGQSGRLLWADAVLASGFAWFLLAGRVTVQIPRAAFLVVLAALIAWSAVTLVMARDILTGVAELKEWLVALAVGVVAARFATDPVRARGVLAIVAVTGALVALQMVWIALHSPFGAALAVLLKKVDLAWGRTNYLAGILILALPVTLGLLGWAAEVRARVIWILVLALITAGLAVSASKGAFLALFAALVAAYARGGRAARTGRLAVLAVVGLAVALYAVGPLQPVVRYRLQASALEYSAGERLELYRLAWNQFTYQPVWGIGLNNFSVVSNRLRGVDTVPHNFELGFLAELGLPGMLLAVGWLGAIGVAAWRTRSRVRAPRERALGLGLWATFLALALHNQFESTVYGEQFKILLMLFAAATWRLANGPKEAAPRADSASRAWRDDANSAPPPRRIA